MHGVGEEGQSRGEPPLSAEAVFRNLSRRASLRIDLEPSDLAVPESARGYQVTNSILVSHWLPAFNRDFLARFGVRSILCLDGKLDSSFASELGVEKISSFNMPDGVAISTQLVKSLVEELKNLVARHPAVLVHCNAGQSRSPSIVAAYLARYEGLHLSDACRLVRDARSPLTQVRFYEATMRAIKRYLSDS